jgi:large conductance mechanosensitive channel
MDTNPTPAPSASSDAKAKLTGIAAQFAEFLRKTNALAVAIGICLGLAVKDVVDGVVACFIQPIIALVKIGGDGGWGLQIWIFQVGRFLGIVVNFLIIAWVLFLISKWFIKEEKKPA